MRTGSFLLNHAIITVDAGGKGWLFMAALLFGRLYKGIERSHLKSAPLFLERSRAILSRSKGPDIVAWVCGIWILEDVFSMVVLTRSTTRCLAAGACALIVTLLLAACGGGSATNPSKSSSGPVTNGDTSSSTSKAAATSTALAMTPAAMANAVMKTYNGNGFTIKYPQNWKVTSSTNGVAFSDPTGAYNLSVGTTPNTDGSVNAEQLVNGGITGAKANLKNVESVAVPSTISFAGQNWTQRAIAGANTYQGKTSTIEANVLATNHPNHASTTRGYVIAYVTLRDKFAQAKSMYFEPMLQSFKFNS